MMGKKILAIHYSQSGQLTQIIERYLEPFVETGCEIDRVQFKPLNDFPFPWTSKDFFNAMPESVLGIPIPLTPVVFKEERYDLVILGYQPWFLSPSIPTTSILSHQGFQKVIHSSPVITIIGARNMWINGQEKVKAALVSLGAKLVGNVTLVDRHQNHVSAVTILYWMLTGKKDKYLGLFPNPGVSDTDIRETRKFGVISREFLIAGDWSGLQKSLVEAGGIYLKKDLIFIENTGSKIFKIWANIIVKKENRTPWLSVFKYYLLSALFIVAPILVTINKILIRPFFQKEWRRKTEYYQGVN